MILILNVALCCLFVQMHEKEGKEKMLNSQKCKSTHAACSNCSVKCFKVNNGYVFIYIFQSIIKPFTVFWDSLVWSSWHSR